MPAKQQTARDIKIGSAVRSREGNVGRVINLIVEPGSTDVTHIVVETTAQFDRDVVVPVVLILAVANNTVDLDLSTADLNALPEYTTTATQGEQASPREAQTSHPNGIEDKDIKNEERAAQGRAGESTLLSDEDIAAAVSDALARDPRTTDTVIDVAYSGGSVTLRGQVRNRQEKAAAVEVARSVPGVVAVIDEIEIVPDAARRDRGEERIFGTAAAAQVIEHR